MIQAVIQKWIAWKTVESAGVQLIQQLLGTVNAGAIYGGKVPALQCVANYILILRCSALKHSWCFKFDHRNSAAYSTLTFNPVKVEQPVNHDEFPPFDLIAPIRGSNLANESPIYTSQWGLYHTPHILGGPHRTPGGIVFWWKPCQICVHNLPGFRVNSRWWWRWTPPTIYIVN